MKIQTFHKKEYRICTLKNSKLSINKVLVRLQNFMEECYDKDGNIIPHDYQKCRPKNECKIIYKM